MGAVNSEKTPEVLQGQLVSLANSIPTFDAIGYCISESEAVSRLLLDKGVATIKQLVEASQLFEGGDAKWNMGEEPPSRAVAEFLQKHMLAWRQVIIDHGVSQMRK